MSETVTTTLNETTFADGTQASGSWTISYATNGTPTLVSFDVTVTGQYPNDPAFYTATYNNASLTETSPGVYALTFNSSDGPYAPPSNPYAFGTNVLSFSGMTPTDLNSGSSSAGGSYISTGPTQNNEQDVTSGGGLTDIPCFTAGTLILTPTGEVRIEDLKAGDLVTLGDGRSAPIRWLGRSTVSIRFADPLRVMPIRISAGALGENLPTRDLLVSPDHAIFIDDVLVNASALVNGASIFRETKSPETFVYYHIELATHELIIAEGCLAETFVDNVDRMGFDNWEEHEATEVAAPIVELSYPRAKASRQTPKMIRDKLSAIAATFPAQAKAA